MAHILFFEKPGCANNTRQKAWLQAAGHQVEAVSLLTHPFTRDELLGYFGARPVSEWWNRAAPRIKSGEVIPENMDVDGALALMLSEPLLIRRPLIQAEGRCEVGFDIPSIHGWLGLPESVVAQHGPAGAEACVKAPQDAQCPPPSKAR